MTGPLFPAGLSQLAARYDAILCDVWGVVHNGRRAFDGACEALAAFRNDGGRVVLITNAPVPKDRVLRYFKPLGVPDGAFDDCVSSGDAARAMLSRRQGEKLWILGLDEGWDHDRFLYDGLNLTIVERPEEADIGLLMGLRDQDHHPEDYRAELRALQALGLPVVCANPDRQVRIGERLYWCGGALAEIYADLGGEVVYPGKPHQPIYQAAFDLLKGLGTDLDRTRLLAIGDGPATDIKGANAQGIDAMYVGTGLADHETGDFETETVKLMREHGVRADYAMPALRW